MKNLVLSLTILFIGLLYGGIGDYFLFPPDSSSVFPPTKELSFQLSGDTILVGAVDNVQIAISFERSLPGTFDPQLVFNVFKARVDNQNPNEIFVQLKTEDGNILKRFVVNTHKMCETEFTLSGNSIVVVLSSLESSRGFTASVDLSSLLAPISPVAAVSESSESLTSSKAVETTGTYRIESFRVVPPDESIGSGYKIESFRVIESGEKEK